MSINQITPTFNNHIPSHIVDEMKIASDVKDSSGDLIVGNKQANNPRVAADQLKDKLALARELNDDFSHCKDIH